MRITRLGVLAAVVAAIAIAPAVAFHDGGVAHCNGCHTMHNSQGNAVMANGGTVGNGLNEFLLLYNNRNDLCLNCHAGYNGYHVWADDVLDPGFEHGAGNFVFLEEDNINDGHGGGDGTCSVGAAVNDNEALCIGAGGVWTWDDAVHGTHGGHSLISGIKGTVVDPVLGTAPGGSFDSTALSCTSCHDPHGNASFRLTYKAGQSAFDFTNGSTDYLSTINADGINLFFLFGGDPEETNTNHNAYYDGYSAWCGTCHGDFHASSGNDIHPSGETLGGAIALNYNKYNGTTNCVANPPAGVNPCGTGVAATAYLAMVPFEEPTSTGIASTAGPTDTSMVACVSCHRAHASSGPDNGRWDFNVTGLDEDGHESGSYAIANPYDGAQRSLCNKCHSKDEFDDPIVF